MEADKKLTSWLQDAHAIEQHVEQAMQKYADATKDYPDLRAKLAAHVAETRQHRDRLEAALKSLGHSPSGFGSAVAKVLGTAQTAASAVLGDAILTNAAASYALEQLEVATYSAIVVAAERAGRSDIARACRENMAQDSNMANWLLERMPQLTQVYLSSSA